MSYHSCPPATSVNGFTSVQHVDKLYDLARACLGLLRILNPKQDRVAVPAVQCRKKLPRFRTCVQSDLEVVWHRRLAGGRVGIFPLTVFLRVLDHTQARRTHSALCDERFSLLFVDLGQDAFCRAAREALEPVSFAVRLLLAINPAIAERPFHCLRIRQGRLFGALLRQA